MPLTALEAADIADRTFQPGEQMTTIPFPKQHQGAQQARLCPFKLGQPASALLTAGGATAPDNRVCEGPRCMLHLGIADEHGRVTGGECSLKLSALASSKQIEILAAIYNSSQVEVSPTTPEPQNH